MFERNPLFYSKGNSGKILIDMKTAEEFELKQSKMSDSELINLCQKEVGDLASTDGKSHRMTIPPMITDTDMLLSELIKRFKVLSEAMRWRDPNTELPDYYKKVIVKYERNDSKIDYACVARLADDDGAYFFGDYNFDIVIDFDKVIGWRPIE